MKTGREMLIPFLLCAFCLLSGVLCSAWGEPGPADPVEKEAAEEGRRGPWEYNLMFYWWLSGPTGKITTGDDVTHINASAFELFDLSDNAGSFFFYGSFVRKRLGFFVDLTYGYLGVPIDSQKAELGPLRVDLKDLRFDTENISVEFAALYRIARWYRCEEEARPRWKRPSLGLDAYAGLRYAHTDLKLDGKAVSTFSLGGVELWREERPLSAHVDDDSLYPLVGVRIVALPVNKFSILLQGDIGGFGVDVDLALHAIASVAYTFRVSENWFMGIHAGYRALNERDEERSGPDRTETDLTVHGPWFGFGFHY